MQGVDHLREIAAGRFSQEAMQWLSQGVARTIDSGDPQSLFMHLGLNQFSQGWVTEIRRQEWLELMMQCHEILTTGGVQTKYSAARIIAAEIKKAARSKTPPASEFSKLVKQALDVHPTGAQSEVGIYNALSRVSDGG
jgi:hypothetical protein